MPKAQLAKWGNSLAIRLPKTVVEQVRMQEGDAIEIEVVKGRVELRPADRVPTLKELVAQITRENRYEEVAIGAERGKESVEW
jgi:antitoxin MazE